MNVIRDIIRPVISDIIFPVIVGEDAAAIIENLIIYNGLGLYYETNPIIYSEDT